jgi:hypothetical protein
MAITKHFMKIRLTNRKSKDMVEKKILYMLNLIVYKLMMIQYYNRFCYDCFYMYL